MVGAARREVAPWRPQSRRTTARIRAGRRPWGASIRAPTTAKDLDPWDRAGERGVDRRYSVTAKGVDPAARKGVDLCSDDREGCRSAAWSELEGSRSASPTAAQVFDPRHRADRICSIRAPGDRASVRSARPANVRSPGSRGPEGSRSARPAPARVSIHGMDRAGRVSIRAPGAREGCRSTAWIGPEGCRSARPATPKGVDPRDRADRICSIRAPGDRASVRSTRAWSGVQVFDPHSARPRKCSIRASGKCSIRRIARAGRVSIRAPGDTEGSRSTGSSRPDLFDPSPRRPRKCSIRAGVERGASVRSALRPAA